MLFMLESVAFILPKEWREEARNKRKKNLEKI